jgi:ligand-binding SRPBCC domain-containing protein
LFFYKTMMQFTFVTPVNAHIDEVAKKFNKELLLKLNPPFIAMELIRYDGQRAGDQLSFKIGIGPIKQQWNGIITAHRYTEKHWLFRDEGLQLPHPLKTWKHTHALKSKSNQTLIIDRLKFEGKNPFFTLLMCLPFIAMFWMRKPLYKKHLGNHSPL